MIVILLAFMLIGFLVQNRLKSKFKKYSNVPLQTGLSGREIAIRMLHDNGITDVEVLSTPGKLTDHYDPRNKTVNLSPEVYNGRSVAAAAVAAHECGHALQHAQAYKWLEFRSAMVPAVSFSSRAMSYIFLFMILGMGVTSAFSFEMVIWVMIILQAIVTLFTMVTLPVEYDASDRALVYIQQSGVAGTMETSQAKDALKWAANTYLVAALASLTQLAYYILLLVSRD
ncbi:MAG: zinc metallopeptidase [Cryomorphaceae bacterium]|nr:zinc metallopeptidase [Cryomorphaceae bacterium]